MGRSAFLSALFTLSIFGFVLVSCIKTDECKGVNCQNWGTCNGGTCSCPSGYTGTNCEKRTCEANNTSQVRFENKSATNLTYSVIWDGLLMTTVAPGVTSQNFTVAAGEHTLHFQIANSGGQPACTPSTPVLIVCNSHSYSCTK